MILLLNSFQDEVYWPKQNIEPKCKSNLVKFGEEPYRKNKDGEYEYIRIKCPEGLSDNDCYRRSCNCDVDRIDENTNQQVSVQNGWECLPPIPLETFNTMFLSPSPMKYAIDKDIDTSQLSAKINELEIGFKKTFVSFKFKKHKRFTC